MFSLFQLKFLHVKHVNNKYYIRSI